VAKESKKEKDEVVESIRFKIETVEVDRTQWKPYKSNLTHPNLFVEVPLDEFEAVEITQDGGIVLSLDGLAGVMVRIADSIQKADDASRIKRFGH